MPEQQLSLFRVRLLALFLESLALCTPRKSVYNVSIDRRDRRPVWRLIHSLGLATALQWLHQSHFEG